MLSVEKDLKNYIKPLIFICKTISFWSFNYDYNNSFERLLLNVLSALVVILFFYCMYRQILVLFIAVKLINSTVFAHHVNEIRHIYGYTIVVLICLNNFFKSKPIKESFEKLCIFEYKNAKFTGRRSNITVMLLCFILTVFGIVVFDSYCFSNYLTHFKFTTYILSVVPESLLLIFILIYEVVLSVLADIYRKLNKNISFITFALDNKTVFDKIRKQIYVRHILKVSTIHYELKEIAIAQNNFYEIPQMLYTSYAFIGFVINYNYLRITTYPVIIQNEDAGPLLLNDFLWCVYYCSCLFIMIRSWTAVESEVCF